MINDYQHSKTNRPRTSDSQQDHTPLDSLNETKSETYGAIGDSTNVTNKDEGTEMDAQSTKQLHTRVSILIIALSVHSIFEGLALGLQDSPESVWTLFIALVTHKSIIAFSVGLQLAKFFEPRILPIIYKMVTFALMSPIGAAVGVGFSEAEAKGNELEGKHNSLGIANAVLHCIAAGTFMYITFFEILAKSVSGKEHPIAKVLSIVLGFVLIALLELFM